MSIMKDVRRWLPGGKDRLRGEIAAELEAHVEQLTQDNIAAGMAPVEARRAALLRFGNSGTISDHCQQERQVFRVEEVASDMRFGLRLLKRNPGFTFVAVLTLALGIGANSAIFSLVHGILLQQLPYNEPERLLSGRGFSIPDYEDFRQRAKSFDRTGMWATNLYTVVRDGQAEQVPGVVGTPELYAMLGSPLLGRIFRADENNQPLVLLSYEYWQSTFGGRDGVLGQAINLNGTPHTIVGVMPRGFHFPSEQYKFWVTFGPSLSKVPDQMQNRALRIFGMLGHLRPEATVAEAQAEMQLFSQQQAKEHPDTNKNMSFRVRPILESTVGSVRPALLILLGTVAFILLIACANVANLLLARTASRKRELAVRVALGAKRGRVLRQLVAESVLLSVIGGFLGLALAWVGLRWLRSWQAAALPRIDTVSIDWTVLLFTFVLAVVTGVIFGVIPAWHASNAAPQDALKEGGRTLAGDASGRMRATLVVVEVALAMVVSIGAGLLVKSFLGLMRADTGFSSEHLLTGMAGLVDVKEERRSRLVESVLTNIERIPGVQSAGAGTGLPPETPQRVTQYEVSGSAKPLEPQYAYFLAVTPGYLPSLQTRLLAGRFFGPQDTENSPKVTIISEKLAHDRFASRNPIGEQLKIVTPNQSAEPRTIVGVVADVRYNGLDDTNAPAVYTPYAQNPQLLAGVYIMVRTTSGTGAVANEIRRAALAASPDMYIVNLKPMEQVVDETVATPKMNTSLLVLFAVLAVVLSATGVYGLIAFGVTRRLHEIGIRIALGASPANVAMLVMRQGLLVSMIGVVAGAIGGIATSRFLRTLLFEVEPTDPRTFLAAGTVLAITALAASYIPVRRATKVDPMEALRYE
jgi:putative ABC transport system permease protein